jgi:hypothetical protein
MATKAKLRKVRLELQARLGFGATDNPTIAPILNSFIDEAERQLYAIGTFKELQSYWDLTVPVGSANVAYPTSSFGKMNPDKIDSVWVDLGAGSAAWAEIEEGIRPCDYTNNSTSNPSRYERRSDGFEFHPERDASYAVRIFSTKERTPLANDDDELVIDRDLVFALALAAAKSHYRHPDSQLYLTKAQGILNAVKWQQAGPKLIRPKDKEASSLPKPRVV